MTTIEPAVPCSLFKVFPVNAPERIVWVVCLSRVGARQAAGQYLEVPVGTVMTVEGMAGDLLIHTDAFLRTRPDVVSL